MYITGKTKSQIDLELKITDKATQIMDLNEPKVKYDFHSETWRILFDELLITVFDFCDVVWPKKRIHRFEKQISNCLRWCLGAYKKDKTSFINYLSHSLKKEINRSIAKEINLEGTLIAQVKQDSERSEFNSDTDKTIELIQFIPKIINLIKLCDQIISKRQERCRAYDSDLLSRWILRAVDRFIENQDVQNALKESKFCNKEMLNTYIRERKLPSQKMIGEKYNRDKTDASREMRKILSSMKKKSVNFQVKCN